MIQTKFSVIFIENNLGGYNTRVMKQLLESEWMMRSGSTSKVLFRYGLIILEFKPFNCFKSNFLYQTPSPIREEDQLNINKIIAKR